MFAFQELSAKFSPIDSYRKSQLKDDGLNWDSEEAKEIYVSNVWYVIVIV